LNPRNEESKTTIEQLYIHLQSGDLDSFSEVFFPLRGRIVRLAQQRLQRDELEDVVQQTLSVFWEKRQSVRDPEHLLPFLFQILRNKLGDTYRQRKRQREIRVTYQKHLNPQDNGSINPELLLEKKELEKVLKEAISICASENRLWGRILQFLQEGRSREEIQQGLGDIPMSTVYTRIYRARQSLMKILKDEFGVDI
jgi:RNA polymerase sigma factor (sigma-70 family)